ncbi:sigma-70 family RNA polymerase sigma factor [Rhodoplanes sp. TEM]|uniref:Sigma-70 family RNA polymerase sigma factor n=1 Tax=Rhodoplanes tepidamans TaxID=200616 RepID=A0ABT5JF41_RHOTP|nr:MULTISPECIES: sigma-70 family RNA polymerase sigma factor [Rhodoplanes]MDC7788319.1 sigma-70 family RNA polymerase sigma factor [Rhodoplanes tepidamans]MDC7986938.1 sigma-70 family RNA polymerase sigma factor [Rhodoplanes sp. TEM]MDQ0358800.1 RNA polymerase sigma-70 factor (ECF subfamily) [Rhodoplanes tepidamans]
MAWDLQTLFRHHASGIRRSLMRRGLTRETAADITQDTFLRVLAAMPADGTENHNPKAYLYQVSRNLGLNHLRRERLAGVVDLPDEIVAEISDPAPTPETIVCDREHLRRVAAALDALPERTRRAFELHRIGGLTIAEVAGEIGLSTTRTWALVHEAYRHIVLAAGGL